MRSTEHAPKVDPTHEKLLALSQATNFPDTAAVGSTASSQYTSTPSMEEGRRLAITEPREGRSDGQASGSRDPKQPYPLHRHAQSRVEDDGTREHAPPQRAFAHPKKCPVQ